MALNLLVPLILLFVVAYALRARSDVYRSLLSGGRDGLKLLYTILPALVMLLTVSSMLRASGALDTLSQLLAPLFAVLGVPVETLPLILIRPISGSAALAVGAELIARYGADSRIGLTAAVMLGSTETTFYTVSVYFGAVGIRKTRYAIPAALFADLVGFLMSALTVRLLF